MSSHLLKCLRGAATSALLAGAVVSSFPASAQVGVLGWPGYGSNPQHAAIAPVAAQSLQRIKWSTPVDLFPQYAGNDLLIHYGSPLITANNTILVPVKNQTFGSFQIEAHRADNGARKWTLLTDFTLPPNYDWTPSFAGTLTPDNTLYIPGPGGTLYFRTNPDAPNPVATLPPPKPHEHGTSGIPNPLFRTGQVCFYGISVYRYNKSQFDDKVHICTPITSDKNGNLYFGYVAEDGTINNLKSGIARISSTGTGLWVSAAQAAGDNNITKVVYNCAPAVSNDGATVYVGVNNSNGSGQGQGYLLALDSQTLATKGKVLLTDVLSGQLANLDDDGTSSPTVGPDGDVFYGVLETPWFSNNDRGWLLHFSGDLTQQKAPGAFGWDDTPSIVPASAVPSYHGSSSYLILTKYNNYAGLGTGTGVNKVGILDPHDTFTDPVSGATVMKEVITVAGVTPDTYFRNNGYPNAVREWCINNAAVDPFTKCALVNSEDGVLYRWDFTANALTQSVVLTPGIGEAYTPTIVGPDGTVYAINNATLFAVGQ